MLRVNKLLRTVKPVLLSAANEHFFHFGFTAAAPSRQRRLCDDSEGI